MITFKIRDLDILREKFDPEVVNRALNSAVNKTANKARTFISKKVREKYNVKARDIANALHEIRNTDRDPQTKDPIAERVMIYTGGKLSLMYFSPREIKITKYGAITTVRGKDGLYSKRAKKVSKKHRQYRGVSVLIKKAKGRKMLKGPDGYGGFIAQGQRGRIGKGGGGFKNPIYNVSSRKEGRGNVQIFMRETRGRYPIERKAGPSIPGMVGGKETITVLNDFVQVEMSKEFDHAMGYFLDKAGAR